MSKLVKSPTRSSVLQRKKRIEKTMAALDKQFDLGFITEKEFFTKRKKTIKRSLKFGLIESDLLIKEIKSIARRRRLFLTGMKQDFMLLLATPYATKEVTEGWETAISIKEKELNEALEIRDKAIKQKEVQLALLARVDKLPDTDE